jgi:hypothetical protein
MAGVVMQVALGAVCGNSKSCHENRRKKSLVTALKTPEKAEGKFCNKKGSLAEVSPRGMRSATAFTEAVTKQRQELTCL